MEKLRIDRNDLYEIEVNDNGDTIVFDINDVELPLKLEKCVEDLNKLMNDAKAKEFVIDKKEDVNGDYILTRNQKEKALLMVDTYKKARKALDVFLGDGGCDKIFGNANYLTMFDDLFEALKPHFEKMQVKHKDVTESVKIKYGDNEDEELS